MTDEELAWLKSTCTYFPADYLSFLKTFRFRPFEQVRIEYDQSTCELSMHISGKWLDIILYEIPLLSLVSEAYFKFVDLDWDYVAQYERAYCKAERLLRAGCKFAEFGTRRRRDYRTHELVVKALRDADVALRKTNNSMIKGNFTGTSNVHFARIFGVAPIGTLAHEL